MKLIFPRKINLKTVVFLLLFEISCTPLQASSNSITDTKNLSGKLNIDSLAMHASENELNYLFQNDMKVYYEVRKKQLETELIARNEEKITLLTYKLGEAEMVLGLLNEAKIHFLETIERATLLENNRLRVWAYRGLGDFYYYEDKISEAMDHFKISREISRDIKDRTISAKAEANATSSMAMLYRYMGIDEEAKNCYIAALELYESVNFNEGISYCYGGLSNYYLNSGDYKKAIEYSEKQINLIPVESGLQYANAQEELALLHLKMNNINKSKSLYIKLLPKYIKYGDEAGTRNCLVQLASISLKLESNIDSTISLAQKALNFSQKINDDYGIMKASEILYKAYKSKGNLKKSLEMNELFLKKKDVLRTLEQKTDLKIEVLRSDFEKTVQKQTVENKSRADKLKLNRNIAYIFATFILLLIFSLYLYYLRKLAKSKKEKEFLLDQLDKLSAKVDSQNQYVEPTKIIQLDKQLIMEFCNDKLNDTDWNILEQLEKSPEITNREIANAIFMSYDAVLSSLKKMYKLFDIDANRNHKLQLMIKLANISKKNEHLDC